MIICIQRQTWGVSAGRGNGTSRYFIFEQLGWFLPGLGALRKLHTLHIVSFISHRPQGHFSRLLHMEPLLHRLHSRVMALQHSLRDPHANALLLIQPLDGPCLSTGRSAFRTSVSACRSHNGCLQYRLDVETSFRLKYKQLPTHLLK